MARDLRNDEIIREIAEKIKAGYGPEKIILFGSYAWGEPDRDSDIDLLVLKETDDRPIDRRVKVRTIVSDRNQRIAIELLVMTPAEVSCEMEKGNLFLKEILERGRVLHAV